MEMDDRRAKVLELLTAIEGSIRTDYAAEKFGWDERETDKLLRAMQADKVLAVKFSDDGTRLYSLREPENAPSPPVPALPFKDMNYDQVADRILAAIDAQCWTRPQMKRHAGFEPPDDISDVVDGLLEDKIITSVDNGNIIGFFRVGRIPVRFWSEGDKCGAEWTEGEASPVLAPPENTHDPRVIRTSNDLKQYLKARSDAWYLGLVMLPHSEKVDTEQALIERINASHANGVPEDDLAESINEILGLRNQGKSDSGSAPGGQRKGIAWTPEMFRNAARRGLSQAKFAAEVGVGAQSVVYQLKKKPFRDAWDEGLALRTGPEVNVINATTSSEPEQVGERITEDVDHEDVPAVDGNLVVADQLPQGLDQTPYRDPQEESARRFGTTEPIVVLPDGSTETLADWLDRQSVIEKVNDGVTQSGEHQPASVKSSVHYRYITFKTGGQVLIGFEGNVFDLSWDDRNFLDHLTDLFQAYPNRFTPEIEVAKKGFIARLSAVFHRGETEK